MANQTKKVKKETLAEEKVLTKKELKEQQKIEAAKQKNKKPKKEKKPGLFKRLKEAWSELKKTTKPTFVEVVKKTSIVIFVVIIFTIVLFGIDLLLGLPYQAFMG
ncbi:MAG: preprotein translocase subunit SecE [Clostridia bacterium]|nr:preprotein translocase subunit SecE [Clostridia bacterium]